MTEREPAAEGTFSPELYQLAERVLKSADPIKPKPKIDMRSQERRELTDKLREMLAATLQQNCPIRNALLRMLEKRKVLELGVLSSSGSFHYGLCYTSLGYPTLYIRQGDNKPVLRAPHDFLAFVIPSNLDEDIRLLPAQYERDLRTELSRA